MKKLIYRCFTLLLLLILLSPLKTIHATPDGWVYGQQIIYVNEQRFEVWGYRFWEGYGNYRLRDIAYILSGTPAQFNIREPLDDYLHFWIERGTPYHPTGTELSPFYDGEHAWREIGGFHAYAVEHFPIQTVILSMDGIDTPEINTTIGVLSSFGFPVHEPERLVDLYNVYVDIGSLAGLLGFDMVRMDDGDGSIHITTNDERRVDTLVTKPLELLSAIKRMTGHWVDRLFFDSDLITQDVVWPHEFEIGIFGLTANHLYAFTDHPRFVDFQFTGVPLAARQPNVWHHDRTMYGLSILSYDDGIMKLSIGDGNRAIQVDLNTFPVKTFIYYVDGIPHEMVRLDPHRNPGRYHFEPLNGGGVRITFIADYQAFWHMPLYVHVYRSQIAGEQGERLFTHVVEGKNDHIFFEITDPTAEPGIEYFYTVTAQSSWGTLNTISIGGVPQMAAHFGERIIPIFEDEDVLGEPEVNELSADANMSDGYETDEFFDASETNEIHTQANEAENASSLIRYIIILMILIITATAVLFFRKRVKTHI